MKRLPLCLVLPIALSTGCKEEKPVPEAAPVAADAAKADAKVADADADADEAEKDAKAPDPKPAVPVVLPPGGTAANPAANVALQLVPDGANVIAQIETSGLMSAGASDGMIIAMLTQQDPEAAEVYRALSGCGFSAAKLQRVTIAIAIADEGGGIFADGEGLGDITKLECAAKALEGKSKKPITFETLPSGQKVMAIDKAIVAPESADRLLFASRAWGTRMLASKGAPSAVMGTLKPPMADVNRGAVLWVAGALDDKMKADAAGSPLAKAEHFSLWMNGSEKNLELHAVVTLADAGAATELKGFVDAQWAMIAGMAPAVGLPPEIAQRLTTSVDGAKAKADLLLNEKDLATLGQAAMGAAMGGMGGPGMGGPGMGAPGGTP